MCIYGTRHTHVRPLSGHVRPLSGHVRPLSGHVRPLSGLQSEELANRMAATYIYI